jgi:proteasome accessory factor C
VPGERRRPAKASERLRRLLTIVPYVVRHPGARIPEVCELFDLSREELLEDLRLIWTSGLPPYGPGDLMDVLIEGDRIWIRMAETFARPLRLSRGEAIALYLRAKALVGEPGLAEAPALASALGKLERGLGEDALAGLTGRVETADGGRVDEDVLEDLRAAARVHERIRIEYYAASSAETSIREVDPEEVFTAIGRWYVVAWDHRAADERLFRVDRIRSVEPIGVTFEPRGLLGAGRPLYSRTPSDVPVRLLLGPSARWVAEYYEVEEAVERDGGLEVVLPAGRLEWVARLVVRLGGEATVVEPPELVSAARDLAERTLARYRGGTRRRS